MYDSPSLSTQWSLAIKKKKKESNKDGTGKGESAGFSNMQEYRERSDEGNMEMQSWGR